MSFNNSHSLDIEMSDEECETILNQDNYMSWEEFEKDINRPVPFYIDIWNLFRYRIPYRIESFIDNIGIRWQRSQRGYADQDVWNMYVYIADILSKMSIDLSNGSHGSPPGIELDEWNAMLRKVGNAFAIIEKTESEGRFLEDNEVQEIREAFGIMQEYFLFMWD